MKKLLYPCLVTLLTLLIACSKGDDQPNCGDQLDGSWRAYSFKRDGVEFSGFPGQGGLNEFEIEFSDFRAADNRGDSRTTYQFYQDVTAPPVTGTFSTTVECDQIDLPWLSFYPGDPRPSVAWDIIKIDATRLFLEANINGFGFEIKFEKI